MREDRTVVLKDREHALPVSQVKSVVLMAVAEGDMPLAKKRLTFAWLVPTVLCSSETHRSLTARCDDFERRYLRYAGIEGLSLVSMDGQVIDPATYTREQLLDDLSAIPVLKAITVILKDVSFPKASEEAIYTLSMTSRSAPGNLAKAQKY